MKEQPENNATQTIRYIRAFIWFEREKLFSTKKRIDTPHNRKEIEEQITIFKTNMVKGKYFTATLIESTEIKRVTYL